MINYRIRNEESWWYDHSLLHYSLEKRSKVRISGREIQIEHFSPAWQKWMVRGRGYKPSKPALQLMVLETHLEIHRQQSAIEASNIRQGNCRQVPSSTSSIHRKPLKKVVVGAGEWMEMGRLGNGWEMPPRDSELQLRGQVVRLDRFPFFRFSSSSQSLFQLPSKFLGTSSCT